MPGESRAAYHPEQAAHQSLKPVLADEVALAGKINSAERPKVLRLAPVHRPPAWAAPRARFSPVIEKPVT